MTPQLIGNKKSRSFRAVVRFCKERSISFQARDPLEKPLSPGELDAVAQACGGFEALMDREGSAFKKRGLAWMEYDAREELLERPELLRTPILRSDEGVAVDPDGAALERLLS